MESISQQFYIVDLITICEKVDQEITIYDDDEIFQIQMDG